ncbi:dUTP diphosphatase [Bacillus sp. WLY-B-L8]|uniref:dUTP diphosphatase n=1 Tax=Bacillus multifaciens TaxID=3068506 RepID=UPI002742154F|nr:dUTP diphosphatase [Bacillus sp. WLY-B-L8]MDP7979116.1 dUTP diphosphatase [Bacillus sp. WLY-B-L8]
MNLTKLFLMQSDFDNRVLTTKGLTREETFEFRILAFLDELGECMKEWRVFKFWSNNRNPITKSPIECSVCCGSGDMNFESITDDAYSNTKHEYIQCSECEGHGHLGYKNPLLEEYVDGLHFAISLCIDLEVTMEFPASIKCSDATEQYFELYSLAVELKKDPMQDKADYLLAHYLGLGELLGFTLEEIEKAYIEKNDVNHQRQDNGY